MSAKLTTSVPEIIDPVFAKTSPKRSFSMTEYEVLGLFSRKRGSINSGTVLPSETVPCEVFLVLCVIIINSKLQYDDGDCVKPLKYSKKYNQKSIFLKSYQLIDVVPFYYSIVRLKLKGAQA
jgi:hypothetical protein